MQRKIKINKAAEITMEAARRISLDEHGNQICIPPFAYYNTFMHGLDKPGSDYSTENKENHNFWDDIFNNRPVCIRVELGMIELFEKDFRDIVGDNFSYAKFGSSANRLRDILIEYNNVEKRYYFKVQEGIDNSLVEYYNYPLSLYDGFIIGRMPNNKLRVLKTDGSEPPKEIEFESLEQYLDLRFYTKFKIGDTVKLLTDILINNELSVPKGSYGEIVDLFVGSTDSEGFAYNTATVDFKFQYPGFEEGKTVFTLELSNLEKV